MLEIAICDDQEECIETLKDLLNRYLKKKHIDAHIAVFKSGEELLKVDWNLFQIIFLDVVMSDQDGVQTAVKIRRKNADISLIFVSAFLDYATMGYQVKASAYLLKNQLPTNFDGAMDAVLMERSLSEDKIEIATGGGVMALPLRHIAYIESRGRLAIFHGQTECRAYMRLSDLETILSGKGFLRIHRCYIINLEHCLVIKNYQALLDNGQTLPCSRQEYASLVQCLLRWKGNSL